MTKKYIIELPASFEVPKYDGRVKYRAVPVRKIHEAKKITPEETGGPWFKTLYDKGTAHLFVVEE
jgi:hypothetical protein